MAMSPRERVLAIGVGVTVGLFALQYGFSSFTTKLREKQALIDRARSDVDALNHQILKGTLWQKKVNDLKAKSLPTNSQLLIARYGEWLTGLGQEFGLNDVKYPLLDRPLKATPAYTSYKFTMQGQCRTDQLIELLAKYYEKNLLHSISNLKLTSIVGSPNLLQVSLDSTVIALRAADAKQSFSNEPSQRLAKSSEEYVDSIITHNPFAQPNKPPRLATSTRQEVKRGEDWKLKLEGSDPEAHLVKFELVSKDVPAGLKLNESGSEISWKPSENGEFEVVVRAVDNGIPAQSSEHKLALKVVDPPPPPTPPVEPPKFDAATQSRVTALVGGRNGPEVWVRSLTDGKSFQLAEGDDFEVGTIKAKVVSINLKESFAEFETNGIRWIVGMDSTLKDAFEKSKAD